MHQEIRGHGERCGFGTGIGCRRRYRAGRIGARGGQRTEFRAAPAHYLPPPGYAFSRWAGLPQGGGVVEPYAERPLLVSGGTLGARYSEIQQLSAGLHRNLLLRREFASMILRECL